MMSRLSQILAITAAAFVVTLASAQDSPDQIVKKAADDVITAIKNDKDVQAGNLSRIATLAEEKVLPFFDFARMTQLAMGRNWAMTTPEQQMALTREFKTLLVRTYSTALAQYRNQTIEVKPTKVDPTAKEATVRTAVIQSGGPSIPIDYSMEKGAGGWKVYDVLVDGVSLVTNYRSAFNDQIRKDGVDGLIKSLATRNAANAARK
jgi:phospholipid transport system substrate-binding protein